MRGYEFTVGDVVAVGDRWLHTGTVACDSEPLPGTALVYNGGFPGWHEVTVLAFERYAVPRWWNLPIGVLLGVRLPVGAVLHGNVKRER